MERNQEEHKLLANSSKILEFAFGKRKNNSLSFTLTRPLILSNLALCHMTEAMIQVELILSWYRNTHQKTSKHLLTLLSTMMIYNSHKNI